VGNQRKVRDYMLKQKAWLPSLILIFLITFPCLAWAWSGMVLGVTDGDTIKVMGAHKKPVKIRLYGIDTPERGQAFSKRAKQFTSDMVFGKIVDVHQMDTDRYGRTVALVSVDKQLLNKELVKAGLAWVYDRYCSEPICESWRSFQLRARMDKRGLWAEPKPVPPWEFRRKKRKK
jgi:endonuclease YncB( thermonuclease family)